MQSSMPFKRIALGVRHVHLIRHEAHGNRTCRLSVTVLWVPYQTSELQSSITWEVAMIVEICCCIYDRDVMTQARFSVIG